MKIFSLTSVLFLLLTGFNCLAQTNFVKGYYVTFGLDTVHGLIEYRTKERNTKFCSYKASHNAPATKYTPDEVYSYVLDDKVIYRGYSVKKMGESENVFLEVLVKGSLNFLKSYGSTYYLETKEGKLIDLPVPDKKLITIDYKTYLSKVRYTKGVLRSLMADYPELLRKVDNTPLSFTLVKNIVIEYNQVENHKLTFVEEAAPINIKPHISFGLTTSARYSRMGISDKEFGSIDPTKSWSIAAGGLAQLFIPTIDENIRLNYSLLYGKNSFYFSQNTLYNNNDIFINFSEIRNGFTIEKGFPQAFGIFVEGGLAHSYTFSRTYSWRQEDFLLNSIDTEYIQKENLISPGYLGPVIGFGKGFRLGEKLQLVSAVKYSWLKGLNKDFSQSTNHSAAFEINLLYK